MVTHMATGLTDTLQPAVRSLSVPVIRGGEIFYKADGVLKSAVVEHPGTPGLEKKIAVIEDRKLVLYRNGEPKVLIPYPDESYIWPSVSPDGRFILAYAMGKGAFVCDQEGNLLKELGNIEAPVWAADGWVAGMVTRDDGHRITESAIVLADVSSGERAIVSPQGIIAMNPSVAPGKGVMVFHTDDGAIYRLTFRMGR